MPKVWPKCDIHTKGWHICVCSTCILGESDGQKCLHLLCMHALSGCDTTSYPYGKGNVTALKTMVSRIYQCLAIIGDIDTTHTELMNAAIPLFHYSQPPVTSMESTCYNIFTKKKRNPSDGFTSNICKPSTTLTWDSTSNHVVESSRLWRYCRWVKRYHKFWVVVSNQNLNTGHCWRWSCSTWVIWCESVQNKRCSTEVCGCHKQHAILQLSWWTGLLESIHCN